MSFIWLQLADVASVPSVVPHRNCPLDKDELGKNKANLAAVRKWLGDYIVNQDVITFTA